LADCQAGAWNWLSIQCLLQGSIPWSVTQNYVMDTILQILKDNAKDLIKHAVFMLVLALLLTFNYQSGFVARDITTLVGMYFTGLAGEKFFKN